MHLFNDTKAFFDKFRIAYDGPPRILSERMSMHRRKFLQEELDEYTEAVENRDLHGQVDALVDLVYVALGTAYLHGVDFEEVWRRVHAANMAKVPLTHSQSRRDPEFDTVMKPPGWMAPDLSDLLLEDAA